MRTLPLRLAPLDGESLPGYVIRYAHTFGLQPGDVVRALGLDAETGTVAAAGRYGLSLSREQLERASRASGIATERLGVMLLARYAGRAFALSENSRVALAGETQAHELFVKSSRFCPRCLRDNGAWLVRWQLGWSIVCVRHRVMLQRCCPKCAGVPRIGVRARWPRDNKGVLHDPSRCWTRRGHRLCRSSLTTAKVLPVTDGPLVDAQQRINSLLEGQLQPTLAGEELDARAYLHDLRVLANLIRASRDPSKGSASEDRLLTEPLALASFLPEALRLADLPDRATLADALRDLAERRYRENGQTPRRVRMLRAASAPLGDAVLRARSETAWAPPSSRMGFSHNAYRRPHDLDPRLDARHVPQLLWASDYEHELAELFDFDDFSARLARRFCSVLLARMLTPLDWSAAVRYLELPERFQNDGYNTTFVKLRQNGRFDELARRIKRLANQHAEGDLIDYRARRHELADWAGIDPETWLLLQPVPRPATKHVDPPTRRAHASVWLWCQLTSGHEHAAPVELPCRELHDHTIFVRRFVPRLRERLLLLGQLLLHTPNDIRQTLPTQLAAALHERGYLAESYCLDTVNPLIAERVLAHTSAHTGVDIPTLTNPPRVHHQPPAIRHARLLAAALLRKTTLATWPAIASVLGGSPSSLAQDHHAYTTTRQTPTLTAEVEKLKAAIQNWQTPNPDSPPTPHTQRMHDTALAIKAHATKTFTPSHGTELARRTSILACRAHTDLTWAAIAAIHNVPAAQPTFSQATITSHRRNDPDFDHRYRQLLKHARTLQREAGYENANLTPGLISKLSSTPHRPT
jgi:hypothetical protein